VINIPGLCERWPRRTERKRINGYGFAVYSPDSYFLIGQLGHSVVGVDAPPKAEAC